MNAGKLNRRLKLYQPTITVAASGQQVESFTQAAEVWAQFVDGRGKETFEGEQKVSVTPASFVIRYRDDVQDNWEVEENGVRYQILSHQEVAMAGVSRLRFLALYVQRKF